jgi:glycerol-3-phosphate dehydrogenase
MMEKNTFDICVIGGGINGAGIARDAVGRGYKVLLIEKGDLACATSSASTKLIHGGLRYLEQYEFGLVKKALRERDILMHLAPHIIWPMRFVLPHASHLRPLWMIRTGVWIYDFLAGKTKLPKSNKTDIQNKFLGAKYKKGIAYSDCWVEDSRLVVLNAMDAGARGATIKTNTECVSIEKQNDQWDVQTSNGETYHTQMIVNAAGPWASKMMEGVADINPKKIRLVKGSHIVIPKLYNEQTSYILQNEDGRIVFTIPYENDYTLIGTTDVDMGDDPDQTPALDADEKHYLKDVVKEYFNKSIRDVDIIHSYSGVRPLMDNEEGEAAYASRDYDFDLQDGFLSVLGGKLTTYRVLAQEAVDLIDEQFHNSSKHWTANEKLPGGDIEDDDFERFVREQITEYPYLSKELIRRYARAYGTCMNIILANVRSLDDMGQDLGGGVYGHELDYLKAYEFAQTGEDVLWRRSKLGLHLDEASQKAVIKYMKDRM